MSLPRAFRLASERARCLEGYAGVPAYYTPVRPTSPIHLMSFCTSNWTNASDRFKIQTEWIKNAHQFFKSAIQYHETDLDDDFIAKAACLDDKRNFLYSWKPYLLDRHLATIPEGDCLLYVDSGCSFPAPDDLPRFLAQTADEFSRVDGDTVLLGLPVNREHPACCASDCCSSILEFFGLTGDRKFLYWFPHYEAGIMLMRNTERTRALVRCWRNTMLDNLSVLFSDKETGATGFVHNSCDQSILQAILYQQDTPIRDCTRLCYDSGLYARCRG